MKVINLTDDIKTTMREAFETQLSKYNSVEDIKITVPALKQDKLKVYIDFEANRKMEALVNRCDKEIAWHGTVYRVDAGFYIKDIVVFPQVVTGTSVNTNTVKYAVEWLMGLDNETFNALRFHGHSHVNMGCTPSGTDTDYQRQLMAQVTDFYLYGIFNKRKNVNFTVFDFENNIMYENKDIDVIIADEAIDWADAQIKEYIVEPPKPVTHAYGYQDYAPNKNWRQGVYGGGFNESGYHQYNYDDYQSLANDMSGDTEMAKKIDEALGIPDYENINYNKNAYEFGKYWNYTSKEWEVPNEETLEQFASTSQEIHLKNVARFEEKYGKVKVKEFYGQK